METVADSEIRDPSPKRLKIDEVGEYSGQSAKGSSGSDQSTIMTEAADSTPTPDPDSSDMESSDDELYTYTEEGVLSYNKQMEESQGYDVDYYPGILQICGVQPVGELSSWETEYFTEMTQNAIDHYNKNNNAQLKFVKIIKVNCQCGAIARSYITFEAKDGDDGDIRTYQTRVRVRPEGRLFEEFRLKP